MIWNHLRFRDAAAPASNMKMNSTLKQNQRAKDVCGFSQDVRIFMFCFS